MTEENDLIALLDRGEYFEGVGGNSPKEIYETVCPKISLPPYLGPNELVSELMQREGVLSTAVGNGIAIPHPKRPLLKSPEECKIIPCFLSTPINMNAADAKPVSVMFLLLSCSTQTHIKSLAALAKVFKNENFRKELMKRPPKKLFLDLVFNARLDEEALAAASGAGA